MNSMLGCMKTPLQRAALIAAAFALTACSKITGLHLEGPYAALEAVQLVLTLKIKEFSFKVVPTRAACPPPTEYKGYCLLLTAEEPQEVWNNPFTVTLDVRSAQDTLSVVMKRSNVEDYTPVQQAFALAVWEALKERGVVLRVKREEESLSVPD